MHENSSVNSTLSCGSDAHPAAQYQWTIVRGSGAANGSLFVIDSPGFFNVSCTAYNFPRASGDQCTGTTLYATGYVHPAPQCDDAGIAIRQIRSSVVRLSVTSLPNA